MKIDDFLTYTNNSEDLPFLTTKLFDVNVRLLKSSILYRIIINSTISYLQTLCKTTFEDYSSFKGMSGANAAIPFNIIVIKRNTKYEIMLNPRIRRYSNTKLKIKSNCGSIRLTNPIEIERYYGVEVEWYDLECAKHIEYRTPKTGSLTIQHEIEHNLGILITDRKAG